MRWLSQSKTHAVAVAVALLTPMGAWAQTVPTVPAATATTADDAADAREDEDGKVVLSPQEYEPPRPPTAAEVEAAANDPVALRKQIEREFASFLGTASSFGGDIRDLIKVRYNEQRERIAGQYDREIDTLEDGERERRLEAIARFEEFVRKYPDDPDYTPDAMFRLAELYFEKSSDEYLVSTRDYEDQLVAFDTGEIATEPEPPAPSYDKTIGLYQDLLGKFPDYAHGDAARYLLGYSYGEQGQLEDSLQMYSDLATKHPTSKFLPEVWTRIGEIYFDMNQGDSLARSVDAYRKVLQWPDSPYFDKALYKLAWAHYRLDQFDEAVVHFVQLVDFADEQKKLTGRSGSELRTEALQYIAISLADEKWGGLDKAKNVLGELANRPYAGEMWKRYGEVLFDQTRYKIAIEALRLSIEKYPNAPYNPEVQAKIVAAYERQRDFDGATKAREELVANFAEGSTWHEANKDDKEAIGTALELTEKSLYTAAIFHHQQAQAYKQSGRAADARASYRRAAEGYEGYLSKFPASKNAYDFNFYLAECFYYSDDYVKAAQRYELVRDSNEDNRHLEAAALSSVITVEKEIERQIKLRKLKKIEFKSSKDRGDAAIVAKDIAPIRLKLVDASDRFMTLLPKSERVPAVAYRAAEVFYKHDQFEEARKRFEAIVIRFPGAEVARYSANLIIESYLAMKDWDNVEKWSQRLMEIARTTTADDPNAAQEQKRFVDSLKKFKVGARFKKAEAFDAAGEFENAANMYVSLVDESPEHEFADKALFNAAVAFEKVKRFDTASKAYQRIYDNYPSSELADRSLFRVGVNYEKGFDFAGAISAYTKLVERYPNSEHRADSLYNVAVTLENMQQYGQAAAAFKRYATTFPDREDAGDMFFRSATVYEKMEAWPEVIKTLKSFIKKYGKSSKFKGRIVEAYKNMGVAELEQNNAKSSRNAYSTCLKEYKRRGFSTQDRAAAFAAECAFELAEDGFRNYDKVRLVGTGKKQIKSLKAKALMQRSVEKAYQAVFGYKRVETTLAASYRIGYTYERFAEALFAAEIPPEFQNNEDAAGEYKLQLEDKAAVLERKAETAYRKAYDEARRTKVTNDWTQKILEGLNKYQPEEFPVQKNGKSALQTFTITGHGLDTLDVDPRKSKAAPAVEPAAQPAAEPTPAESASNQPGGDQ